MHESLIERLRPITDEEKKILEERRIRRDIYTTGDEFTIDRKKMLGSGRLIDIRTHARFIAFPKHKHNYIEITYMCTGETTHIINDGTKIVLKEGELLFFNQHCYHEILPAGENDIAVNFMMLPEFFDVAFDMLREENAISNFIISSLKNEETDELYLHFCVSDVLPVQNLMENLVWGVINKSENDVHINQLTMGLLFVQLLKHTDLLEDGGGEKSRRMMAMKAVKYIEDNYNLASLTQLAKELNISVSNLSKIVKAYTGCTFKELLQTKRLSRASYLLCETDLPVTDIIYAMGYDNTSYFHRIFREKYKLSPFEYRKKFGK